MSKEQLQLRQRNAAIIPEELHLEDLEERKENNNCLLGKPNFLTKFLQKMAGI